MYLDGSILLHHTQCLAHGFVRGGLSAHGFSGVHSVEFVGAVAVLDIGALVAFRLTSTEILKARFLYTNKLIRKTCAMLYMIGN